VDRFSVEVLGVVLLRRLIVFRRLSVSMSFVLAALRALHVDDCGAVGRDRPVSRRGGVRPDEDSDGAGQDCGDCDDSDTPYLLNG
jgi:hypothetical protein